MNTHASERLADLASPRIVPPLDPGFRPAVLANRAYKCAVAESGAGVPLVIGLERPDGTVSTYETTVFPEGHAMAELNLPYVERLVKFLLWQKGGYKVTIAGPKTLGESIRAIYSKDGDRKFDHEFMGVRFFERPFELVVTDIEHAPQSKETSVPIGKHLDGCRIGFDLGASDRKVAAVVDGEAVFSTEVVWNPRDEDDPNYHFHEIMSALHLAAARMPRVDAIGGSTAGVVVNNRMMSASLFRGVPEAKVERVRSIFIEIGKVWGVPIEVANDGDVTALAGAMSTNSGKVLGVAMGSSEAAGYVNAEGNITGWLNELAFAPIDYAPKAPADEWSGDVGCGVQYLTQQAVFRLAAQVGIDLSSEETLAGKLKIVQKLLEAGDSRAHQIWETIGCYAGYAVAHYAQFYEIGPMLILGRVTSGSGGAIIVEKANEVLAAEFPELASTIDVHLPDEATRRLGQAVAAASLPAIPGK